MSILNPLSGVEIVQGFEPMHVFPKGEWVVGWKQIGDATLVVTNFVTYQVVGGVLIALDLTVEPVGNC